MNKNFKWYSIMAISLILLIMYAGYFFTGIGRGLEDDFIIRGEPLNTPIGKLPIPPLLEDKNPEEGKAEFDLIVQYGKTEFIEGYSQWVKL